MSTQPASTLLWIAREFGNPSYLPLTTDDLDALAGATTIRTFGSGARLFKEGDPPDACYLIRTGTVRLIRDGRDPFVLLALLHSGHVVGDYAMLRGQAHPSAAIAHTPVTAIEMPREPIMAALVEHPRIALRWLLAAMKQVEEAHERVTVLLRKDTSAKIAAFLLSSDGFQRRDGFIEVTHDALAEMVGAERATVSRAVGRLRDDGILQTSRGSIQILDEDALGAIRDG